jgi:hypothetical protein
MAVRYTSHVADDVHVLAIRKRRVSNMKSMSDLAQGDNDGPQGLSTLPRDLTEEELRRAPVLASADLLIMDDLTEDEFEAFDRAVHS